MPADMRAEVALLWCAYVYLRDHDLSEQSSTSRLLRSGDTACLRGRLVDELGELAGVMDGTHRHHDLSSDVGLEGSQVCYWTYILAIRYGVSLGALDPAARLTAEMEATLEQLTTRLRHIASLLATSDEVTPDVMGEVFSLVGQCCRAAGVDPTEVVSYDLAQMKSRPYMAAYFETSSGSG